MPLHKSTRAPRLDPTMISAPLGDFRHTMHIGRGGDAFGDTSFLSTLGPSPPSSDPGSPGFAPAADPEVAINHSDLYSDAPGSPQNDELQHSESVSSFTLDLDLDLGPSMLGDVLGVMDGLGLDSNEEDVFSLKSVTSSVETKQGKGAMEESVNLQNELNGKNLVGLDGNQVGDGRIPDGNGIKPKGLKPKVRFSDKREEIIRQASEEDEGQAFDFQDENTLVCQSPTRGEIERAEGRVGEGETEFINHKVDLPPSPASSNSSEYEDTQLDRRRVDSCHSETDSEEEGEAGRGYTFEDEFDDEIGL
ncbi:putative cdc42 effector protein 5 [Scophthalmus maximus]|uniref:CDC42 effector protein (Rho GTPase binding) 5 n=2 Tax=Scophthalmus maximus TaxID=52904 RepID=A0A2U9AXZ9_SCOMX|nr:cdc42 effector protein 5 [Scophthalmus maximus]AWO96498.1 putative cdc42 effector protein 5 [Scophthalmus maximus]